MAERRHAKRVSSFEFDGKLYTSPEAVVIDVLSKFIDQFDGDGNAAARNLLKHRTDVVQLLELLDNASKPGVGIEEFYVPYALLQNKSGGM